MLHQHKLRGSSQKIECEEFSNSWHLRSKVLSGPQGLFNNYNEYANVVSLLNALHAGNKERFESLMAATGIDSEYKVNVTSIHEPRNPYSVMQLGEGAEIKTLLEIAEEYNQLDFVTLLEEQYAPALDDLKSKNKI